MIVLLAATYLLSIYLLLIFIPWLIKFISAHKKSLGNTGS